MILVAGGGKGGSGKSTIATNLTILRAQDSVNNGCIIPNSND